MSAHQDNVLLEVRASDGRVYSLTRERLRNRTLIHHLVLPVREWEERFKDGGRDALRAVAVTALLPAVFLYGDLYFIGPSSSGNSVAYFLTHTFVALLVACGLTIGFPIGLFLRHRPHRFSGTFGETVTLDGDDVGSLVRLEVNEASRKVILVTDHARKVLTLRTAEDAVALRDALERVVSQTRQ